MNAIIIIMSYTNSHIALTQQNVSPCLQTETKRRPTPSATQRDYAIPMTMARPTSPVARLLDRYPSAPAMSMQAGNPEMDPITRQYYNRMWSMHAPSTGVYVEVVELYHYFLKPLYKLIIC